jgi:hypothetical protein
LLRRFYQDLILTNFPDPDELDPPELWERMLTPGDEMYEFTILHIVLAYAITDTNFECVLGGNVLEYYPRSKCSLMSFIVVHDRERRRGLGKILTEEGYEIVNHDAQERDGLPHCKAYFAETNNPDVVSEDQDSMSPVIRLSVLQRLGFHRCVFDFIQPPLTPDQRACSNLLLCVYLRNLPHDRIHRAELLSLGVRPEVLNMTLSSNMAISNPDHPNPMVELPFLEAASLKDFLQEYWESCDAPLEGNKDWEKTKTQLEAVSKVFVVPLSVSLKAKL